MHAMTAAIMASLMLAAPGTHAQAPPAQQPTDGGLQTVAAQDRILDTATVQGKVPGPGLWKVQNGPNVFWILGVQSPVPAKIEWNPGKVRAVIAQAQEVVAAPGISIGSDIGFFGALTLAPSLLKLRNNPDGKPLKDVVPASTYARWVPLRQHYFGNDRGIEKRRPIIAATTLYGRAMERAGLGESRKVLSEVNDAVKRRKLKWTPSMAEFKVADVKGALRELRGQKLADVGCFERTLDRLEGDVDNMRLRANAWALGDIETLRRLQRPDQYEACENALLESAVAARHGVRDARERSRQKWISNAEAALGRNRVTFGTLPMRELLTPDGVLARLAAKGFTVEAPTGPPTAAR